MLRTNRDLVLRSDGSNAKGSQSLVGCGDMGVRDAYRTVAVRDDGECGGGVASRGPIPSPPRLQASTDASLGRLLAKNTFDQHSDLDVGLTVAQAQIRARGNRILCAIGYYLPYTDHCQVSTSAQSRFASSTALVGLTMFYYVRNKTEHLLARFAALTHLGRSRMRSGSPSFWVSVLPPV